MPRPTSLSDAERPLSRKFTESVDPEYWEPFRIFCVSSIQNRDIPAMERLLFAKAALEVVSRKQQSRNLDPVRSATDEARIRAYVIFEIGVKPNELIRDPETAASLVLSTLREDIQEIGELCER